MIKRILLITLLFYLQSNIFALNIQWTKEQKEWMKENDKYIIAKDGWFEIKSINYLVRSEISREFTLKTACFMEMVRIKILSTIGSNKRMQYLEPLLVVIAKDNDTYKRLIGANDNSRGKFKYTWKEFTVWTEFTMYTYVKWPKEIDFDNFYHPILIHEGTHQLLQQYAGHNKIPNLISEGFATFMQSWNVQTDINFNQKLRKSEVLKLILGGIKANDLVQLSDIIDAEPWDIDGFGRKTIVRYFLSEMLIEYLIDNPLGKKIFTELLEDAFDGKVIINEYKMFFDDMQKDFNKFVLKTALSR